MTRRSDPDRPGRNDPCPCGSGRKYKKCCLDTPADPFAPARDPVGATATADGGHFGETDRFDRAQYFDEGTPEIVGNLFSALAGRRFASEAELDRFMRDFQTAANHRPLDDFAGLSPDQMHRLMHLPFDSPDLVRVPERPPSTPDAPIVTLFGHLVEAIGEKGLKPTATGNLPRALCRDSALRLLGEEGYRERTRFGGINSEPDFPELHHTRVVAEFAGLLRKYRGRFILGRECRALLAEGGTAAIYPRLFRSATREFDWAYTDGYPELLHIQHSFLFTLYLLHRFGGKWRSSDFYADRLLRAFPALVDEVEADSFRTPEEIVRRGYALRVLHRMLPFLGLAESEALGDALLAREYRVRKRPLLDQVVRFSIG